MKWIAALLAWTLLAGGNASAHQITFSHIALRLESGQTLIRAQIPIAALLQQTPPPLPPGTTEQMLRAAPVRAEVRAALVRLLTDRLHLRSGREALPLSVGEVGSAGDDIAMTVRTRPISGTLGVDADLFPDDSLHKVFVDVYRGDVLAGQYALDRQSPAFTLEAPERPLTGVIATFVREGVHHIFIGPDHILFVLALVLLGGSLWTQAKIITAFTLAHSITLALATLNIVQAPPRLVESTIALSIVAVGLHDLRQLRRGAPPPTGMDLRIVFAFVFGLVHGFGFAGALIQMDLPRKALAWSLAAFNVGVEIGQVAIVLTAAPALYALRRYAPPPVTRQVLSAAAGAVALVGGFWFCQRAFF